MSNKIPESVDVLVGITNCLIEGNAVGVKALKQLLGQMDARTQQVYITNVKKLLTEYPLFNLRVNEKTYTQLMVGLNEMLKESAYKVRRGNGTSV